MSSVFSVRGWSRDCVRRILLELGERQIGVVVVLLPTTGLGLAFGSIDNDIVFCGRWGLSRLVLICVTLPAI